MFKLYIESSWLDAVKQFLICNIAVILSMGTSMSWGYCVELGVFTARPLVLHQAWK
jgi:hypothetical protein